MADPKDRRPTQPPLPKSTGSMWPQSSQPSKAPASKPAAAPQPDPPAGRIKHDERGNAVWDWLKETSRIFIGSTSALLKKLDAPELKMEDDKDQELRLEGDKEPGGGYDPYNQRTPTGKKPPGKR